MELPWISFFPSFCDARPPNFALATGVAIVESLAPPLIDALPRFILSVRRFFYPNTVSPFLCLSSPSLLSMFVSKETRNSFAEIAAAADRRGSACGMAASTPEHHDLNFSGAPTSLFPRLTVNHDGRTSFSLFVEPPDCLSAGSRYQ